MQDSGISESGDNMEKKYVTKLLRQQGFKVTPQRIAVYSVLANSKEHPNAEMIYNQLKPMYPTMSLATVYKTMEIFEKIGLVKVLDVGDDCARYDWDTQNHSHIRCTVCNKVEDLMGIDSKAISKIVEGGSEYRVTGQQITFEGICPDCLRKQSH